MTSFPRHGRGKRSSRCASSQGRQAFHGTDERSGAAGARVQRTVDFKHSLGILKKSAVGTTSFSRHGRGMRSCGCKSSKTTRSPLWTPRCVHFFQTSGMARPTWPFGGFHPTEETPNGTGESVETQRCLLCLLKLCYFFCMRSLGNTYPLNEHKCVFFLLLFVFCLLVSLLGPIFSHVEQQFLQTIHIQAFRVRIPGSHCLCRREHVEPVIPIFLRT